MPMRPPTGGELGRWRSNEALCPLGMPWMQGLRRLTQQAAFDELVRYVTQSARWADATACSHSCMPTGTSHSNMTQPRNKTRCMPACMAWLPAGLRTSHRALAVQGRGKRLTGASGRRRTGSSPSRAARSPTPSTGCPSGPRTRLLPTPQPSGGTPSSCAPAAAGLLTWPGVG